MRRLVPVCLFFLMLLPAQDFRVDSPHPRLLLNSRHLRLLRRERDRQSMRWLQFAKLVEAGNDLTEPGFARALYALTANDANMARRAIDYALTPAAGVRQTALVYDWCQDWLKDTDTKALRAKLEQFAQATPAASLDAHRDRIFAALAISGDSPLNTAAILKDELAGWYRNQFATGLLSGAVVVKPAETYALTEILHAARDNFNDDLRETVRAYFAQFPVFLVFVNYPAPLNSRDNDYRVPVYAGAGEPSVGDAVRTRAAGLSLVAFDANSTETQFLQGFLLQDRFLMRSGLGAPYEFLWANPYQPGLSFFHLPLTFHDAYSGTLFLRSSWEEDAEWFGLFAGEAQLFKDGKITVLTNQGSNGALDVGAAQVVALHPPKLRFEGSAASVFAIGLKPRHDYLVEVDDEELRQQRTDAAGTLEFNFADRPPAGVRIEEDPHGSAGTPARH